MVGANLQLQMGKKFQRKSEALLKSLILEILPLNVMQQNLALHKIGVMDEYFWPAYSEDIDYYLRSILEDKNYGRDAYLCRKWGGPCTRKGDFLNSNKAFKAIFRRNREEHEILSFQDQFTSLHENLFQHPYNDSSLQISWWNNTKTANSVASPRSVNKNYAPVELVWKLRDWSLLSSESILGGKNI
ncbi:unnamed protein product [Bathycoccus prasinos]